MVSEVRYAHSGDVAIAYQIVGDGPFDLVWTPCPRGPGEVLVSQTVKDLVAGSGIEFEDRGGAELKGVPGEWRLYAVGAT